MSSVIWLHLDPTSGIKETEQKFRSILLFSTDTFGIHNYDRKQIFDFCIDLLSNKLKKLKYKIYDGYVYNVEYC